MARLGDYVKIRTGKLDANASSENGAYPFFTCSRVPLKIDSYSYDCECALVAGNGDLNVKYYSGKFDAYQRTYIIESKDKNVLSVKYLYCFLDGYIETLRKQAIGGVIKYIKLENLTEAKLNIPDIKTQEETVTKLEKVDELISCRKEQLAKLDELVKARFVEMFGNGSYLQIPLIQLIVEGAGLSYGIIVPGDNVEDGVPMLRPSDFNNGELCLDNVYRVTPEIEAKYTRTRLIGNEILVQVIGQPGQIMLSDSRCKGMNVTRNLAVVRPDCNRINRIYLKTYMQLQEAQTFMLGETKQSTLKQLPLSKLKELEIPVPPMELQEQFATFVKQTEKTKTEVQKILDELEILKKSLMQKYFG